MDDYRHIYDDAKKRKAAPQDAKPSGAEVNRPAVAACQEEKQMKLDNVRLNADAIIHFSGLEGGVSFACGQQVRKGDHWSQYHAHITCPHCKRYIEIMQDRSANLDRDEEIARLRSAIRRLPVVPK